MDTDWTENWLVSQLQIVDISNIYSFMDPCQIKTVFKYLRYMWRLKEDFLEAIEGISKQLWKKSGANNLGFIGELLRGTSFSPKMVLCLKNVLSHMSALPSQVVQVNQAVHLFYNIKLNKCSLHLNNYFNSIKYWHISQPII